MNLIEQFLRRLMVASAILGLGAAACDFEVTNPGPVQDKFLDAPGSFPSIVNGAIRSFSEGIDWIALHGAIVTRELFPTGQTGQFGIEPRHAIGLLDPDGQGTPWANAHKGRWIAEDGLRRFREVLTAQQLSSSRVVAEMLLWAGYANRLLGENMCDAVIDGGPAEPITVHLKRAEENFTNAIQTAGAAGDARLAAAATAGRASVRVHLGDWSGAAADSRQVPTDFSFAVAYFEVGDQYQYNRVAWSSMAQPWKGHTVWGTVYEVYFKETGDPRTPWRETNLKGTGALDCCGPVPWYPQQKYPDRLSPIRLSTGREMRLIEAEALLRNRDWQGATALVNQVRTAVGVPPWEPSSLEEAWTSLKRERGIELWLEARRLADMRRWKQEGTPGELDPREVPGPASHLEAQDLCFPIPTSERDTNPNLRKTG